MIDDECRLDGAARPPGRLGDDAPELVVARRADEHLGVLDQLAERPRRGQRAELVGADHDDDVHVERRVEDEVEQPCGDGVGRAGGEHLLELVDDEQLRTGLVEAVRLRRCRERVGPGHDHVRPPRTFAGQPATADQREQTGSHERRLAAPDAPTMATSRRSSTRAVEFGDKPLASDEESASSGS